MSVVLNVLGEGVGNRRTEASQIEGGMLKSWVDHQRSLELMRSLWREREMIEKTRNMTDFKKSLDKFLSH